MKQHLSIAVTALAAAAVITAAAQAHTISRGRAPSAGAVVELRHTALGTVLVDARGRTLYLFEKDRNGVSMCGSACTAYWPPLTSHGTPHAGRGVRASLLKLTAARQVSYAGHLLYTFVGDKRPGQTTGEGLTNFGAGWYVLSANGTKIERSQSSGGSASGSGSGGGYGSSSGGGY